MEKGRFKKRMPCSRKARGTPPETLTAIVIMALLRTVQTLERQERLRGHNSPDKATRKGGDTQPQRVLT